MNVHFQMDNSTPPTVSKVRLADVYRACIPPLSWPNQSQAAAAGGRLRPNLTEPNDITITSSVRRDTSGVSYTERRAPHGTAGGGQDVRRQEGRGDSAQRRLSGGTKSLRGERYTANYDMSTTFPGHCVRSSYHDDARVAMTRFVVIPPRLSLTIFDLISY